MQGHGSYYGPFSRAVEELSVNDRQYFHRGWSAAVSNGAICAPCARIPADAEVRRLRQQYAETVAEWEQALPPGGFERAIAVFGLFSGQYQMERSRLLEDIELPTSLDELAREWVQRARAPDKKLWGGLRGMRPGWLIAADICLATDGRWHRTVSHDRNHREFKAGPRLRDGDIESRPIALTMAESIANQKSYFDWHRHLNDPDRTVPV
jgi:hypothetical protein